MELSRYIACICEGAAEQVIIEKLLDADKLIFWRTQLLEEKIIRCRSAKSFEERYLRKGFTEKITVLRILDSRKERFKLSKAYEHKVNVINIITAPEVEMLVILHEKKYKDFKKSRKKPSEFCKENLHYPNVKSTAFVHSYFDDVDTLVRSITNYRRISNIPKGEYSLLDLLTTIPN
jgi:hypothetical protein